MREIGAELGIDSLLTGSVRRAGTGANARSVRVTIQLLQASDERQLWSTTYDRIIDDIFEVQSDIAVQVTERLGATLLEGERRRLGASPTTNHEAYTALFASLVSLTPGSTCLHVSDDRRFLYVHFLDAPDEKARAAQIKDLYERLIMELEGQEVFS